MKRVLACFTAVLLYSFVFAGDFKYQSTIDNVSAIGYYDVVLTPDIVSKLNDDFADLRLFDSLNNEIPYILKMESAFKDNSLFREHKILSNTSNKKEGLNKIVIENTMGSSIDYLYLVYRSSEIEKEITLKGSDDLVNWFIIAQAYPEIIGLTDNNTAQIKYLKFPRSSYKYFMVQTSIKKQEPLQLIRTGYYENGRIPGQFVKLQDAKVKQADSSKYKQSFVKINLADSFKVSKIRIFISSPDIYYRKFKLFIVNKSKKELIGEEILSSRKSNVFDFPAFRAKELLIVVENEDNQPLKIDSISAYQLGAYITAKLYRGEKYLLRFGNKDAKAPSYDLEYFKDKIPDNLEKLTPSAPLKIGGEQQHIKAKSFFNNTIVWIILVVVIGAVALVTIKLSREV
jgi:hypothetical protein